MSNANQSSPTKMVMKKGSKMESLNFDDYIRNNPSHKEIEFKIFEMKNRDGANYYIKFLAYRKRFFRDSLPVWVTLCYADGNSQGFVWTTKYFSEKSKAEQYVGEICQSYEDSEITHFMKRIK